MSGDFTRDSFDPLKNFTRVLMQQGRPQLDADWNEQIAIFWQYWRTFMTDLIGPYAGPAQNCGFGIVAQGDFPLADEMGLSAKEQDRLRAMLNTPADFLVSPGHYYVNGILCQNPGYFSHSSHVPAPETGWSPRNNTSHLVYLDVWERPVSALEDASIREPALNGLDTCIRTKVAWRVRTWELSDKKGSKAEGVPDSSQVREHWPTMVRAWQAEHRGRLRARVADPADGERALGPGYRGLQNQLYRIEIHDDGSRGGDTRRTFKMSRENGSVEFRIKIKDKTVTLDNVGRDARFGLKSGDWVEIVPLHGHVSAPGTLRQVRTVDTGRREVILDGTLPSHDDSHSFLLRRWDHTAGDQRKGGLELWEGAAVIKEGSSEQSWLVLENGLQIQFEPSTPANRYRTGDYWLIPARVATGDILWRRDGRNPEALPPHGVEHHYAPLGIVSLNSRGTLESEADCRPKFKVPVAFGF